MLTSLPFGLVSCRRAVGSGAGSGIRMEPSLAPMPVRVGRSEVTLRVVGADGGAVRGAHISVEADMAHPGMTPVFSDAREAGDGVYRASVDLEMPGDWVVLVHARLADGERVERQFDVRGVQAR